MCTAQSREILRVCAAQSREALFIHSVNTALYVSALTWTSSRSTDTFRETGQQNTCPDVNIRLNSSVLCVTQSSNCYVPCNTRHVSTTCGWHLAV